MQSVLDLESLQLKKGDHSTPEEGLCLLEAVAVLAGEPHSDCPDCVCPVLAAFGRRWNDTLDAVERQRLKRFIPLLVETRATNEVEEQRAWLATDWLVRLHTPAWLRLAGLEALALELEGLPPLLSLDETVAVQFRLTAIEHQVAYIWVAAGHPGQPDTLTLVRTTGVTAAREAALEVVSYTALRDNVCSATWTIARDAAWIAADTGGKEQLEPTRLALIASAEDLLRRMITVKE